MSELRIIAAFLSHARKIMWAVSRGNSAIETAWGKGYKLKELQAGEVPSG
jgi:hypothetical protein